MTSAQQHKLVAALSVLTMAVYFPAASYLQSVYVSDMAPPPPGAVRLLLNLQKYSPNGIGFMEHIPRYRTQPGLIIYEDDRRLTAATGLGEVDSVPGRFAEETGVGIAVSATDGSDISKNKHRYWIVKPDAPR
jgi:hypothetical protein